MKLIHCMATGLAVILAAVVLSAPAHAAKSQPDNVHAAVTGAEVEKIIAAAKAAYAAYELFAGGDLSVRTATTRILNAIYGAKTEILARIDAVTAADAKACTQNAVLDMEIFDQLSPDNQQAFARDARGCVNFIDSHLSREVDKAAVDQIGFALQAVGPIMLISSSRVGFSNSAYIPVLKRSTHAVITKLTPTCTSRWIENRTQWTCTVYTGHRAGPEPSFSLAERQCQARTSRPVAKAILPTLNSL